MMNAEASPVNSAGSSRWSGRSSCSRRSPPRPSPRRRRRSPTLRTEPQHGVADPRDARAARARRARPGDATATRSASACSARGRRRHEPLAGRPAAAAPARRRDRRDRNLAVARRLELVYVDQVQARTRDGADWLGRTRPAPRDVDRQGVPGRAPPTSSTRCSPGRSSASRTTTITDPGALRDELDEVRRAATPSRRASSSRALGRLGRGARRPGGRPRSSASGAPRPRARAGLDESARRRRRRARARGAHRRLTARATAARARARA